MNKGHKTVETTLNTCLAELLRGHGLDAEPERSLTEPRRAQLDVVVSRDTDCVVIECEFAPARTVRDDAASRLTRPPLAYQKLSVRSVFALVYPERFRDIERSDDLRRELIRADDLKFAIGHRGLEVDAHWEERDMVWQEETTGGVSDLADALLNWWSQSDPGAASIEKIVTALGRAVSLAADKIEQAQNNPLAENTAPEDEAASVSALVWANAMIFQELLASNLRGHNIPRPVSSPAKLAVQWEEILKINWWPIFHTARLALSNTPAPQNREAIELLLPAVQEVVESGIATSHDIAGRVFHRLLDSRKFLATNYTTISAAVLLAALAFDPERWKHVDWADPQAVGKLKIFDPACGTGTLLMASMQEVLRRHRRAGGDPAAVTKDLLEKVIHGYDVVPAAVHLTAATLAMSETGQVVKEMPLYVMPHDVAPDRDNKKVVVPRLGSLDFLHGSKAAVKTMFSGEGDAGRRTGSGELVHDVDLPNNPDLIIQNPPYTRAGGPGDAKNTDWNPLFGSLLSKSDVEKMQKELRDRLTGTPASLYAGLGSAFACLADERIARERRVAFVLPATVLSGSRWAAIRRMFLQKYEIDWVVVSHDGRHRSHKKGFPGRRYVGFSESTRIAETLILATKVQTIDSGHQVRFVNLRHNPDHPFEAAAVGRHLLEKPNADEISTGQKVWGEIVRVPQADIPKGAPWSATAFMQTRIYDAACALLDGELRLGGTVIRVPVAPLGKIARFGPYEMQIKNPRQGAFGIVETEDPTRLGEPALWHHSSEKIRTLSPIANARLQPRADRPNSAREAMLRKAGHLQHARDLGHAPQRFAAVRTEEDMLGVSSWITLLIKHDGEENLLAAMEKTLALWLNSTPGLILRIVHANRPYLGRSRMPHELARTFPVLDVAKLPAEKLAAGAALFDELAGREFQGFARMDTDENRRKLNEGILTDVLGAPAAAKTAMRKLTAQLKAEPTITARH